MKIEVGMGLKWQGRDVLCTSTRHDRETKFASESSAVMKASLSELFNCKFMALEIESFEVGDVIDVEYQRVELQVPGRHIFYLYPYYKASLKGEKDGRSGDEGAGGEASAGEAESHGEGVEGGEGVGRESVGDSSGARDRDG